MTVGWGRFRDFWLVRLLCWSLPGRWKLKGLETLLALEIHTACKMCVRLCRKTCSRTVPEAAVRAVQSYEKGFETSKLAGVGGVSQLKTWKKHQPFDQFTRRHDVSTKPIPKLEHV